MRLFGPALALVLAGGMLTGCGGGKGLDEGKIERCATALVPYDQQSKAGGKGLSPSTLKACSDLNANEQSEAIVRMYKKEGDSATTAPG